LAKKKTTPARGKKSARAEVERGSATPALDAYAERIGAEKLNFRRYIVKEQRGSYYIERGLVRLGADGSIRVSKKDLEPTKAEADAIALEIAASDWPVAVGATEAQVKALRARCSGELHVFWDLRRKSVVMCQERIGTREGGKAYVPWTFFSDGEWRRLEPDGALPFWKPERQTPRIMVHEGAKGAKFVDGLVNDPARREELEAHPWGEELAGYCHWGMIGGALAPHRADYDELRAAKPSETVYVCDNDWEGQSALQEVSRAYGGSLKGIRFDKRWPPQWDLADEMPKTLYKGRRFLGPRLARLVVSATHATELVSDGGKGRPFAVLRRAFREEWYHSVKPEVFVHRDWPNLMHTAQEFNSHVRPFSDTDDTARLLKADAASKSADLKYDPSRRPGIYSAGDGGRFINTYWPPDIREEEGSAEPFLDFMRGLVPDEGDRTELTRWVATLVARPEVKMSYGVLMISEVQGVGKGTLGEKILAPLVGASNVSYPSEKEIVDSSFNYWLAHKRLAVIHEIYAGHSSKAYNNLKTIVTDKMVTVSKKYMANYDVENWLHCFACSNSMRAIQLSADDRRWFVPEVTEEKRTKEYWNELNRWLEEGGLGIVLRYCREWLAENAAVERSEAAPWSRQKEAVVKEGYSPGMTLVSEFLDQVEDAMRQDRPETRDWLARNARPSGANGVWKSPGAVVYDKALVELIKNQIHEGRASDRLEKPLTVRKVAKAKGWHVHPEENHAHGAHGKVLCSNAAMTRIAMKELMERVKPLDVRDLAASWFKM
jgi:hypothetical protein